MTTFRKALAALFMLASLSFAQIIFPYNYQPRNPSPNAPQGSCFINTTPVYNYVAATYWFCLPNSTSPNNLGTWTSYAPPNGVVSMNGAGTVSLATSAQINALVTTLTAPTLNTPVINNPVITGPAPVACGATCSPTAGQLVLCATAAGCTMTLPTSAGTGNVIRERVTVTTTSAAEKVLLATVTDVIIGSAIGENGGTPLMFVGNAGTYHSIQMPFAGSQPSGGFAGDTITCTDIAAGKWACDVVYQGGTTPTTPYSTSAT